MRWGFVGCGRLIPRFMDGINQVGNVIPVAIYARDITKAQTVARKYGIAKAYDDIDELLETSGIDIAHIALPHHLHYQYAEKCLKKGIPVLVEKAMAPNATIAKAMVDCARDNNTFLAEGFWSRYFPIYRQVLRWIDDGRIGSLTGMNVTMSIKVPYDENDRLFDLSQAGGVLMDMGVYPIGFSQFIFREKPKDMSIVATFSESGVDVNDGITLKYSNGAVTTILISFLANGKDCVTIYGTDGMIEIADSFWKPRHAVMTCREGILTFDSPELNDSSVYGTDSMSFHGEGFQFEIAEIKKCVESGLKESPFMTLDESLQIYEITDVLREMIDLRFPFE